MKKKQEKKQEGKKVKELDDVISYLEGNEEETDE